MQVSLLGTERAATGLGLAHGVAQGGGLAGEQPVAALELVGFIGELVLLGCGQCQVAPGFGQHHAFFTPKGSASGRNILPSLNPQVAGSLHRTASLTTAGLVAPVAGVPHQRLLVAFAKRGQVDVTPGFKLSDAPCAGVDHLGCSQV